MKAEKGTLVLGLSEALETITFHLSSNITSNLLKKKDAEVSIVLIAGLGRNYEKKSPRPI